MSYKVFRVEYHGDPNHVSLFVRTDDDGSGTVYHVTGNTKVGMTYESKRRPNPEFSASYVPDSKCLVGMVKQVDMSRFEQICQNNPPPGVQHEKTGRRLDPTKPLRRCGDWVEETVDELRNQGVMTEPIRSPSRL